MTPDATNLSPTKHRQPLNCGASKAFLLCLTVILSVSQIALAVGQDRSGAPVAADSLDVVITIERKGCLGECPAYKVAITRDGNVSYDGLAHVRVKGEARGHLDSRAVDRLLAEFTRIDYWRLDDEYRELRNPDGTSWGMTDLPTTITSVSLSGRVKSVTNYLGAPASLGELERLIDEVVGVKRWVSLDVSTVSELANTKWDFNSEETATLAVRAVRQDNVEVVRALLDRGLDANAQAPRFLLAAHSGLMVKLLISRGADVNAQTHGDVVVPGITPLMYAARLANAEALRTLIGAGANLNTVNSSGQTALMFAAMGGNPESVRTILAAGARSDVKDSRGNLALTYATSAAADEKSNRSHRERLRVAGFPQPTPDFETIVELLKNTKPR
jgi:hypothetical protein